MLFFKKNPSKTQKIIHGLISLFIIAAGLFFFWRFKDIDWKYLITLKYFGFALVCLIGSAIVFLPFPIAVFIGVSALFLNPFIVGLLGGIATAIGSSVPYFVGREGTIIFKDIRGYEKIHKWVASNSRGFWSILAISILPIPVFDVVGITSGVLGVNFKKYVLAVLIGKTVCYLSFALMFNFIGKNFPEFWQSIKIYLPS